MMTWTTLENALRVWMEGTFGAGKVIWSSQDAPEPALPYASLQLTGPRPASSLLEVHNTTNLANPAGQEIEQTVTMHGELTLVCQAHAAPTCGSSTAKELLQAARMRLFLPSVLYALEQAGLAVLGAGDTQDLTAILETKFRSRAAMSVRLEVVDTLIEKTGYIATANVTGEPE
jgi:hypothetical protein